MRIFCVGKLSTPYKNQTRNPAIFCGGRTRVCGPRKAGQERVLSVRRNRMPAENAVQRQKDHLWMDTDMVDSCQEENRLLPNCFPAVLVVVLFQGSQRGGTHVATVDHSEIRGLVTA